MYPLVYKYLVLRKKVSIAGVGHFNMHALSARLNSVERMVYSPQAAIDFTEDSNEVLSDKNFYQYLSHELNIDEWEAISRYQQFSADLKKQIETNGSVDLPGIGSLQKAYNNQSGFHFVPERNTYKALNDIYLGETIPGNTVHEPVHIPEEVVYNTGEALIVTEESEDDKVEKIVPAEKKDYWWVYAIILAIMGIGALMYYYI
ncbi:hypothetical protein ACI6Q2_07715 [Chitinophagaceae bacterium LWZ2-11]